MNRTGIILIGFTICSFAQPHKNTLKHLKIIATHKLKKRSGWSVKKFDAALNVSGTSKFSDSITVSNNGITATAGNITAIAGNVAITAGNLTLPNTTNTTGQILFGDNRFVHNYGTANTFVGTNTGNTTLTSVSNTAIGYNSLPLATAGGFNTACGANTFSGLSTGSNNIALGDDAGKAYTSESSNIAIGNNGRLNDSNAIRIGTQGTGAGQQNKCYIAGITSATIRDNVVYINMIGQLGVKTSSLRFKENIQDMGEASSALIKLRPVTFNYKISPQEKQYGLIAEEVVNIFPDLVTFDKDEKPFSVKYHDLPALLLNEWQKQYKKINELEERIKVLESK